MTHLYNISDFDAFKAKIEMLWHPVWKPYEMIYISYGSKFNESHLSFRQSLVKHSTNASYQMVPNFVRYRESTEPCLIIILDHFSNDAVLEKNQQILKNVLSTQEENTMDIVVFNVLASIELISEFTEFMVNLINLNRVEPNKCIFSNFIKYASPNGQEWATEQQVAPCIFKVFGKREDFLQYAGCFYNWFGYSIYTYNLIYRYNDPFILIHLNEMYHIFDQVLKDIHLSYINMPQIMNSDLAQNPHRRNKLIKFLDSCIDITTVCPDIDDIAIPITQYPM